jgi:hypothetical protein
MRYVALVILMIFITSLVMRKANKRERDFIEYLFFSFSLYFAVSILIIIICLFIKYW